MVTPYWIFVQNYLFRSFSPPGEIFQHISTANASKYHCRHFYTTCCLYNIFITCWDRRSHVTTNSVIRFSKTIITPTQYGMEIFRPGDFQACWPIQACFFAVANFFTTGRCKFCPCQLLGHMNRYKLIFDDHANFRFYSSSVPL